MYRAPPVGRTPYLAFHTAGHIFAIVTAARSTYCLDGLLMTLEPAADARRRVPTRRRGLRGMIRFIGAPLLAALFGASCQPAAASSQPPRDAGADSPAVPAPWEMPRISPPLPRSDRRTCRRDTDCAFVERPCTCSPCGESWREVLNRRTLDKLKAAWSSQRCLEPDCPACAGHLIGTKPVCLEGQCRVSR
jgi:hypothetical protein